MAAAARGAGATRTVISACFITRWPSLLAVLGMAAALVRHVHVVEVQVDQALVEVVDAGVAHRRQDAPEVRVAGEERRLHQRRMGDRIGHAAAFALVAAALDRAR